MLTWHQENCFTCSFYSVCGGVARICITGWSIFSGKPVTRALEENE